MDGTQDAKTYKVEAIVNMKIENGKEEYLVKWENYPSSENTWEPAESFVHCLGLIEEFKKTRKPGKTRALRGQQTATQLAQQRIARRSQQRTALRVQQQAAEPARNHPAPPVLHQAAQLAQRQAGQQVQDQAARLSHHRKMFPLSSTRSRLLSAQGAEERVAKLVKERAAEQAEEQAALQAQEQIKRRALLQSQVTSNHHVAQSTHQKTAQSAIQQVEQRTLVANPGAPNGDIYFHYEEAVANNFKVISILDVAKNEPNNVVYFKVKLEGGKVVLLSSDFLKEFFPLLTIDYMEAKFPQPTPEEHGVEEELYPY